MRPIDADALYQLFMVNPKGERIPEVDCDNFPVRVDIHDVKKAILKSPTIDAVPVVRCKDCIWWQDRQIQLDEGSCRDYMPDEPWSVTCDVGINIGSHCTKHGFDDESGSWFWAVSNDYCSCGEREGAMTK